MPHLTLEFSDNLPGPVDWPLVMRALHDTLDALELFRLDELKSRVIGHQHTLIGDGTADRSFIHLTVAILTGREPEVRRQLSERCLATLRLHLEPLGRLRHLDVTVDIREMERSSYTKWVSAPGR